MKEIGYLILPGITDSFLERLVCTSDGRRVLPGVVCTLSTTIELSVIEGRLSFWWCSVSE